MAEKNHVDTNSLTPREIINKFNLKLDESGIVQGLDIGVQAPDFTLLNQEGVKINLYETLHNGPVILSFYRGEWCKHCNRELQNIESVLTELNSKNITVLAVAPQTVDYAKKMVEKNSLNFDLLSDPDFEVIDLYKLKFTLSEDVQDVYQNKFKLNLPNFTANKTWQLPVPATYIINSNRIIIEKYVETDYTKRLTGQELIELLTGI